MPAELLAHMKKVRVAGQPLRMKPATDEDQDAPKRKRSFGPPRGKPAGGFAQPRKRTPR
jgi:ATP-dependent RNA helicase DeaD